MDSSLAEIPRVLFLFLNDQFGEDEQLALEDVCELHSHGLDWRAVCIRNTGVEKGLRALDAARVVTLEHPPRRNLDRGVRDLLMAEIQKGAGIIHAYDTNYLGSILPWMLRHPKVPVIVSEGPKVQKKLRHIFQSFFYSRLDAVLVPSATLKKRIAAMRPVLANRTRVVHPGLDFKVFNPDQFDFKVLRQKWGIASEVHLVGLIASREYVKAQSTFIKAAASFLRNEELATRTRFVIIGFEHDGSQDLIRLIEQFHLQEHIILAPAESSLPKVLGSLDIYVLPSNKAMFGLQAIESLAMGTPIICAHGPDSAEWTGNSQVGLTMRSGDSFDLQRKLRMMLDDPEELRGMGLRAVQFAREHYDRARRTDRLREIYERAFKRRSAAQDPSGSA
ncbi:MAG: glycosyltransferase [Proteobacteria bacterium]|nr:glycosyltransferase [Pseudomonadota bacterium]